jgi:F-type H+-transporting ATPase subunit b
MSKFIIPKTAEMINLRKEKIDGDLEKAAEIKKKVEEMVEKYNEALKNANLKANISLQKTKDELNETIIRRQEDLSAKINAEIEAGEEKIANSKIKALQKIEETSAELAIDVLEKLGFGGIKIKDVKIALMKLKKEQ